MGKSFSAQPIIVLLAWRTQLLIGSHFHVACLVKCCGHLVGLSMAHSRFQYPFVNRKRCQMALWPCWAVMPWLIQFWLIAWKNEHSSCSGWDNCIRTFLSVHLVGSPLICSWNSWSRAWTSLLVTCVISLQNAACFCKSWSRLLRLLSFSLVANGANSSLCPSGNCMADWFIQFSP